jgi:hypothetical protein
VLEGRVFTCDLDPAIFIAVKGVQSFDEAQSSFRTLRGQAEATRLVSLD